MNKKEKLFRTNLKIEDFELSPKRELARCYKYVYKCRKCKRFYGSDRKELFPFLCPICELK